jgi:ankyrin repeat protein
VKGKTTPLHYALLWKEEIHLELIRFLIEKGADVNAHDWVRPHLHNTKTESLTVFILVEYDATPLHSAFCNDVVHLNVVQLLIAKGAEVNARDHVGWRSDYRSSSPN